MEIPIRPDAVRFLCEQDGPPEARFKARLIEQLRTDGRVTAAYLVRAQLAERAEATVVLGLVALREDPGIIDAIARVYRSIFARETWLDILFLNEQQRRAIDAVAPPFYTRPKS